MRTRSIERGRGRGFGPFSGRQLTVVIVAVAAALVLAPVAADAAGGVFTNSSATVPAVKASNGNVHGIGVVGTGRKFGVYSNGPLGVHGGQALVCSRCVTPGDLSAAAAQVQNLKPGQSESGVFAVGDVYPSDKADILQTAITFAQPVPGNLNFAVGPGTSCPAPGSAAAGFVCLYPADAGDVTFLGGGALGSGVRVGALLVWTESGGGDAFVSGQYTVHI